MAYKHKNPFRTRLRATLSQADWIREVFTARQQELDTLCELFIESSSPTRVLVHGQYGIGKTAFIIRLLDELRQKDKKTLLIPVPLSHKTQDLTTFVLASLAYEMDDEWAQQLAHQMGLPTKIRAVEKAGEIKANGIIFGISASEKKLSPPTELEFPALTFQKLVERALEKHSRVIIAIDDLNGQNPGQIREMLDGVEELSESEASFIFTSHCDDMVRNIYEAKLVDIPPIELKPLNVETTTFQMLLKYLNSTRPDHAKCDPNDVQATAPFTQGAAYNLCEESKGVPHRLNLLGFHVLFWWAAAREKFKHGRITPHVLQQGLEYAYSQFPHRDLIPEDIDALTSAPPDQPGDIEADKPKPILDNLVQLDPLPRRSQESISNSAISGS